MIEKYLHTSKNLKAVFLLIDIRHEPSANDRQMYEWILHNGYDPDHYSHKAGQTQKKPGTETPENGKRRSSGKKGYGSYSPILRRQSREETRYGS